ncbi:unnamed protein product [Cylicostephanus goldi]|uniref:Uncharacterized protein n=1 Tax=Cylicostephanus goldi TaxID=71465 RepID=A0A3P7NH92_CYLGO|nr:unnamed protein product [Cylicostephanus goldi]
MAHLWTTRIGHLINQMTKGVKCIAFRHTVIILDEFRQRITITNTGLSPNAH